MIRLVVLRCKARFIPEDLSTEEWAVYTDEQKLKYADWCPVVIPWAEIEFVNESHQDYTTVNLKSGTILTIDIPFEEADILLENFRSQSLGK